ncbi:head maturation protease, ClpP-related [Paenibacillus lautus]|uniref:head maturation protease, ClpP-related n=1 Tax=Paenibacillus lautus TaxID=1401 RepID=UPI003D2980BD
MPKKLKLNGPVISDDEKWIYDWFEIPTISPGVVSDFLDEANGEEVELLINSGGGLVDSGSEIYTMLKSYAEHHSVDVTSKITALAGSSASVIAMGGTRVLMSPTAQIMIHNSSTIAWGDKNSMDGASEMLKNTDEAIANAYMLKTGMDRDELLAMMNKVTWMNAQQAVELGFADEIMFAEKVAVTNNAAAGHLLPPEVIEKMRNQYSEHKQPPKAAANAPTTPEPPAPIKNKEEPKIMDMNELKEKHPDLYAQITNEAQTAERTRIAALQAYATAPGAAEFINEAITNGGTVQDVAVKVMEASMKRAGQEATNRKLDAEESNVDKVEAIEAKTPESLKEEKKAGAVANMVAMAQNMKMNGGRK